MINRTGILLLAVFAAALFSGCVTEMSADQIVQKMKEKQEGIKDFSATMAFTVSFGGQSIAAKAKIMNKMPDKTRIEYLEPAEMAGQLMVSDGATVWVYDPKTKIATRVPVKKDIADFQQDYISSIRELLGKTNITYLGTEKLGGRTVYHIKTSPKDDSMLKDMNTGIWVDSETWMPLKIEMVDENDKPITTIEYQDVKFNTGIPDSEFAFKVPQGATVVSGGVDQ